MAERTDVDIVRNLVTMLVQSEQFGTSVAKTLRTHSDTLRTQRVQTIEELAAKTTVKLLFPLVLFIFPCLFLVTVGPAVILMSESLKSTSFIERKESRYGQCHDHSDRCRCTLRPRVGFLDPASSHSRQVACLLTRGLEASQAAQNLLAIPIIFGLRYGRSGCSFCTL